jgi:CBS domain-containing protein
MVVEARSARRLVDAPPPLAERPALPIAGLVRPGAVKVPAWFTAAAALRVARLKGVEHLMVLDRQQLVGAVSVRALAGVPGHHPVARAMTASRLSVTLDIPADEALALMVAHRLECLPVVSGALLVGMITRASLAG